MYKSLDPQKTIDTISLLHTRICERFPNSSLGKVCDELVNIARQCKERAMWFSKPNMAVRIIIAGLIAFSIFVLIYSSSYIKITAGAFSWGEFIQILEAGINNILLIGAALFFLFTFEARIKRSRALAALYELRAIAHVIDMHQLTKDPSKILATRIVTPSSPKITLNAYELARYLSYCSEMLSLVGKIAALYSENLRDEIVMSAVNEVEILTTGLSRKIWQKIVIIDTLEKIGPT